MGDTKQAHALFLPENEDDDVLGEEDIGAISIMRTAPHQENAGKTYTPAELPDPQAIRRIFGGGSYKVQARDNARKILKGGTRYYQFQGESFPMDGTGAPTKPERPAAVAPPPPQIIQQAPMDLSPFTEIVRSQGQLINTLLEGQQKMMTEVIAAVRAPSGGGGGSNDVDTLIKGMELGQAAVKEIMDARESALAEARENGGGGGDDLTSTLNSVVGAIGAAQQLRGNGSGKKPSAPGPNGPKLPAPKAPA